MAEQTPQYDALKLEFERGVEGAYTVIAESSDGRRVRGSFTPPFTDEELDVLVRDVGLVRRARSSQQGRLNEIEQFGSELFAALIREQVAGVYHDARAAAQHRKRGLRITLNLSGAPELMRLPWEFLYRRPRFLSQSMNTPVVRSLDLESARRPQEVQLPLRILGMVSSPSGYPELDADEERRKLEAALRRLREDGRVELEWLERATLEEFGRRVAEPDDIHVLHYIGHGAYDETTESGILVLETRQGRAQDVSGRTLGSMLQDEESLRLVVLNSCEGARTSRIDPFSGVAASLLEFDIPAVVGMQFEITDEAAIAFSDSFYTQLAQGLPVDAALGPARRAIVAADKGAEFGTPVLFLRTADARLFEPTRAEPASPTPPHPPTPPPARANLEDDPAWGDALEVFWADRWDEAVDRLQVLANRFPDVTKVRDRLAEAIRQRDLAAWYAQADSSAQQERWTDAMSALQRIVAVEPDYRDAADQLKQARAAHRRESLIDEIRLLHEAGRWQAVVAAGDELAHLTSTTPDPDGMVTHARQRLDEADLDNRYRHAVSLLDGQQWNEAADELAAIDHTQPGYRETTTLLSRAREHLRPAAAAGADVESSSTSVGHGSAGLIKPSPNSTDQQAPTYDVILTTVGDHRMLVLKTVRQATGLSLDDAKALVEAAPERVKGGLASAEAIELKKRLEQAGATVALRQGGRLLDEQRWQAAADQFTPIGHDQRATTYDVILTTVGDHLILVLKTVRQATGLSLDDSKALVEAAPERVKGGLALAEATELKKRLEQAGATVAVRRGGRLLDEQQPEPRTLQVGQWVLSVDFSPDGIRLATGSRQRVRVWNLVTGKLLWDAKTGGWMHDVWDVAFALDGTRLATAGGDKTGRVWDATTGKELLTVNHAKSVSGVAFSPDGTRLATASDDKTARLWDATTGKELLTVNHTDWVRGVAFSPDGTRVATASDDKTARVWDASTGEELLTVNHTGWVRGAVFSPDGTRLATASNDKTARVWDATSGKELLTVNHTGAVHGVVFSPDGTRLATASEDKTARISELPAFVTVGLPLAPRAPKTLPPPPPMPLS
jgi:ribosomal protein L7/L12